MEVPSPGKLNASIAARSSRCGVLGRHGRWMLGVVIFHAALLTSGCVATRLSLVEDRSARPAADICQLVASWNPEVVFTPDPANNGKPTPGLAGRVYLFGQTADYPKVGAGAITVDLYDLTADPNTPPAAPIEQWRFDAETLKKLQRKDTLGWGYTLFLPWGTYKPSMNRIELRVRYQAESGNPLYASSGPMAVGSTRTGRQSSAAPKAAGKLLETAR